MKEVWKDIPGYESLYQVSSLGNVRSCEHVCTHPKSKTGTCIRKSRILHQCDDTSGYYRVTIQVNKLRADYNVHRLVAEAFIPNPDNLISVNHKNGNKHDNSIDNLEWMSYSDNTRHAHKTGLNSHHISIKCIETSEIFSSLSDASKAFGCSYETMSAYIQGKRKSRILAKYHFSIIDSL